MSGTIRSLPQHILHHALHTPDKTAVIADNGQLTYAQLAQKMQAVCAALQQRGITPGQFAAWYAPLENSKEASASIHPDTCTEMIGSGVI